MVAQRKVFRIVVVASSDVKNECDTLEEIVRELNKGAAAEDGLYLELDRWETDAYPGFHPEGSQGVIDSILNVENCDLLIGIFWKRLGIPKHAFQLAYNSWKLRQRPQIMIYFSQEPYSPRTEAELEEWRLVLQFQKEFPEEGVWWPYKGRRDFGKVARKQLPRQIKKISQESKKEPPDSDQKKRKTSDKRRGSELAVFTVVPPMSNPRTIDQRQLTVENIYHKLTRSDITGIVLTGIGGLGKSTLAALVYRYAEEQRRLEGEPFTAEAIWLTINHPVSLADLGDTLLKIMERPLPDFRERLPQEQAETLFNVLNAIDKPCLIVLDQFDNILDRQTGRILDVCSGIGEWIDELNSNLCKCRVILTSQILPYGKREYPPTCMQEYRVKGLEVDEGIELLIKQGVERSQASEEEMRRAVIGFEGHALSLMLLATILRNNRSLRLADLFNDPRFTHRVADDIARRLLDHIYSQQLNQIQRKLLSAFSVYREPVSLNTALYLITEPQKDRIVPALEGLIAQHLIQDVGESRYRLHAIVSSYARSHFVRSNEQTIKEALQEAHARAAEYYIQPTTKNYLPREKRQGIRDVESLIEATWQYCQAARLQDAYDLMEKERLFYYLKLWGENATLLMVCQLLEPLGKKHQEHLQAAVIYSNLGWTYSLLGQKELAIRYCEQALRIFQELGKRAEEGRMLNYLGDIYVDLGQYEKGMGQLKQALHIFEELEDHRGKGRTLNSLGWAYDNKGQQGNDLDQRKIALTYYEQALQEIEKEDESDRATILNNIGTIYKATGQKEEALEQYEQALHLQEEIWDRNGQSVTLNNLGMLYSAEGKKYKALELYARARHIQKEISDFYGEGVTLNNIGIVYFDQRRYRYALACFLEAKRILGVAQSPDRESTQENIDMIERVIGQEMFEPLVKEVQPQARQILELGLPKDFKS